MTTTLYGSRSTASLVVHWLLLELDVPHDLVLLDFDTREQKGADYLALNPAARHSRRSTAAKASPTGNKPA